MEFSEILFASSLTPGCDESELSLIFEASAHRISSNNTGGVLLYAHGCFMQLIEGNTENVIAAFEQSCKANWHFDIHILLRERIDERLCEGWGFSHVRLGKKIDRVSESSHHFFSFKKSEIKERVKKKRCARWPTA
jgi:hypothetical protein